ncbi:peptide deformylase, partial [Streptomyces prasinus]|uniref:peptide deformylase n=1 Tax=Streptomyces prasinus TaxID=67345 RepID=UPI0036399822
VGPRGGAGGGPTPPPRGVGGRARGRGHPPPAHGTGFFARCLQHECDHLEGRVYADRLTGRRRRRLDRQVRRAPWSGRDRGTGDAAEAGD